MPNLKGIGLQNFRTFKNYEYLEFAPITLITGANNSGKSSIFKAIMLLKSNISDGSLFEELVLDEHKHTMGKFDRISNRNSDTDFLVFAFPVDLSMKTTTNLGVVFKFDKEDDKISINRIVIGSDTDFFLKLYIDTQRQWYDEIEDYGDYNIRQELDLKKIIDNVIFNEPIEVNKENDTISPLFSFTSDLADLATGEEDYNRVMAYNEKHYYSTIYDKIENRIPINISFNSFKKENFDYIPNESLEQDINNQIYDLLKQRSGQTNRLSRIFDLIELDKNSQDAKRITEILTGEERDTGILHYLIPFLNQISKRLDNQLIRNFEAIKESRFLPASRGKLRNWFIDEQMDDFIKITTEYASNYKWFDKSIKLFIDFWLSKKGFNIGQEIKVNRNDDVGLTRVSLVSFDKGKNDKNIEIPLVDLGYGISQIIPIIISIANQAHKFIVQNDYEINFKPSSIIIEEPEGNLHPNLQAKLAELFLDAASRFNIQFILETHSEYLIYKFQEYIGKQIIKPEDVALYYLNHPDREQRKVKQEDGSIEYKKYVNRVPIKEDGSIEYEKYFGTGFFDEQTNLKLSLLNIQRNSFLKLFQKTKAKFGANNTLSPEEQLQELNNLIDTHFEKLDFSTHISFVKTQFPNHGKLLSKSLNYLASGYHLFTIIDDNNGITDYSPAVLQFGRAVENEIHELFKKVKDNILGNPNYTTWLSDYIDTKDGKYLTIRNNDGKIKTEFKSYIKNDIPNKKGKKYEISFGNMRQVFEQLNQEPIANIQSVNLLNALYDYLTNQYFNDWSSINVLIPTLANIVDLRNKSAHTYANPISRTDAFDYKVEVENWLRVWSDGRR
jgi:predicted ATPase